MASQAQRTILYDFTTRYDLSPASTNYDDDQYEFEPQPTSPAPAAPAEGEIVTIVEVKNADCLDEALRLKLELGLNPVVLNMASAKRPGGGTLRYFSASSHSLDQ